MGRWLDTNSSHLNVMKTRFTLAALATVFTLGGGPATSYAAPDDMMGLARYADQLADHGIGGGRFVELVDERFWGLDPAVQQPGMGSYVQEMHTRGLRGRALADAIVAEQQRRGSSLKLTPMAKEQAEKGGLPPPMDRPR